MWAGNLYLGPFEITERIRESVIIFKSQAVALPRHQEEEATDKSKQAQI